MHVASIGCVIPQRAVPDHLNHDLTLTGAIVAVAGKTILADAVKRALTVYAFCIAVARACQVPPMRIASHIYRHLLLPDFSLCSSTHLPRTRRCRHTYPQRDPLPANQRQFLGILPAKSIFMHVSALIFQADLVGKITRRTCTGLIGQSC